MTIEHGNLTNSNLHECKGVSDATAGLVQVAQGDGTADWVSPSSIEVGSGGSLIFEATRSALYTWQRPSLHPAEAMFDVVEWNSITTFDSSKVKLDFNYRFQLEEEGIYEVHCELQASTFPEAAANTPISFVGAISYVDGEEITKNVAQQVTYFTTNSQTCAVSLYAKVSVPAKQRFFVRYGVTSATPETAYCGLWNRAYTLPNAAFFGTVPAANIKIFRVG